MTEAEPLIIHAAPADRPTIRRRAIDALHAGRRVNVFTSDATSTELLFSARAIANRIFIYGSRGALLLGNPAGAIDAGLAWMV